MTEWLICFFLADKTIKRNFNKYIMKLKPV